MTREPPQVKRKAVSPIRERRSSSRPERDLSHRRDACTSDETHDVKCGGHPRHPWCAENIQQGQAGSVDQVFPELPWIFLIFKHVKLRYLVQLMRFRYGSPCLAPVDLFPARRHDVFEISNDY